MEVIIVEVITESDGSEDDTTSILGIYSAFCVGTSFSTSLVETWSSANGASGSDSETVSKQLHPSRQTNCC